MKSKHKHILYQISLGKNQIQERKLEIKIWTDLLSISKLFYLFGG